MRNKTHCNHEWNNDRTRICAHCGVEEDDILEENKRLRKALAHENGLAVIRFIAKSTCNCDEFVGMVPCMTCASKSWLKEIDAALDEEKKHNPSCDYLNGRGYCTCGVNDALVKKENSHE